MNLRRILLGLWLGCGLAVFPLHGRAASLIHFSGQNANSYFSSIDESGCIATDVVVFAFDGRVKVAPGPREIQSEAVLVISKYDYCTEAPLMQAWGQATLADPDFQMRGGNLNSARLTATIPVYDEVSTSFFEVFVDLAWTGIGAAQRGNEHFHWRSPGFMVNSHSNSVYRAADVSGTVSDGTTVLNSGPNVFGDLSSARSGTLTVTGETTVR